MVKVKPKAKVKPQAKTARPKSPAPLRAKRTRLSQTEVPGVPLSQALRVPVALHDDYAGRPTAPLHVAAALDMQPTTGHFRTLCGAAIAYGLTTGGYNSPKIEVTPLGTRAVRPAAEGEDLAAKREAFLKPSVIGEFLRRYNHAKFPREDSAKNVIAGMGVPNDRLDSTLAIIKDGARDLGLLSDIKGIPYVALDSITSTVPAADEQQQGDEEIPAIPVPAAPATSLPAAAIAPPTSPSSGPTADPRMRRVYISHGKDVAIVELLKTLLAFTDLEPLVSVQRESVSQPVPDKVMNEMRMCGAALIHVDAASPAEGPPASVNGNVLIEIGAAMALYGRRFILVVRNGSKLPSNLQGLYELRYDGDSLDGAATMKLLAAIAAMKKEPLPPCQCRPASP